MIFKGHNERKDENENHLIHIITNNKNFNDQWLVSRIAEYKSKGFKVRVKYITGKKK